MSPEKHFISAHDYGHFQPIFSEQIGETPTPTEVSGPDLAPPILAEWLLGFVDDAGTRRKRVGFQQVNEFGSDQQRSEIIADYSEHTLNGMLRAIKAKHPESHTAIKESFIKALETPRYKKFVIHHLEDPSLTPEGLDSEQIYDLFTRKFWVGPDDKLPWRDAKVIATNARRRLTRRLDNQIKKNETVVLP